MSSAAYLRVRESLKPRSASIITVHVLGALQACLLIAALVVGGLIVAVVNHHSDSDRIALQSAPMPGSETRLTLGWVYAGGLELPPDLDEQSELAAEARHRQRAAARGLLAALLTGLLIGLVVYVVLDEIRRWLIAELSGRAAVSLRHQIHRQIYRLGQSALPTQGIGPVVDLFTREVNDVRDGIAAELNSLVRRPLLIAGLLGVAFLISWLMALTLLVLLALVALVTRTLTRRAELATDAAARTAAVQLSMLQEDLGLIRLVRIYGIESVDKARFDDHLERYRQADVRRMRTEGHISPATVLLVGVTAVVVAGVVGAQILDGTLSLASAVTLLVSLGALVPPVQGWRRMRLARRRAERSATAIVEYMDRRPEILQAGSAKFLAPCREQITFENVTVETPNGRTLLEGVSLRIPAGSKTAIMGRDEESKQALVCLIPRLLDPKIGRVRVDGLDLRDVTLDSLRAQVASVLQSDLVFSDSVTANISLGDPSYDLPRIMEAAKFAHTHNFIQDLPDGYDTFIGPMGEYLRVDEQYRIALARAYLHDPSIVIIEEPISPMDDDMKHLVDDTIARLAAGRTLIFIPHRLSTIRSCDQVVILHNGRVEATGTSKSLQAESKLFRHLQYVEFNQFAAGGVEAGQMNV